MNFPDDLKYTKEHEWCRLKGKIATIGISDYAQDQLGDIVFVELPEKGDELAQDEPFGVIESVKAVSDLICPLSGEVVEVNTELEDTPELVNSDPYGDGWIIKAKILDPSEINDLMDSVDYEEYVAEEAEDKEQEE